MLVNAVLDFMGSSYWRPLCKQCGVSRHMDYYWTIPEGWKAKEQWQSHHRGCVGSPNTPVWSVPFAHLCVELAAALSSNL